MSNYFEQVANMLGLELYEKFKIQEISGTFAFEKVGLYDGNNISCEYTLNEILRGSVKIIKLPWIPKRGETYYCVSAKSSIVSETCECDMFDAMCVNSKNCFKTEKEATDKRLETLKLIETIWEGEIQ